MKVTVKEAAKILKRTEANVYQLLKKHNIETKLVDAEVEYHYKRRVKRFMFELEDLTERGK